MFGISCTHSFAILKVFSSITSTTCHAHNVFTESDCAFLYVSSVSSKYNHSVCINQCQFCVTSYDEAQPPHQVTVTTVALLSGSSVTVAPIKFILPL